jgi:hypothetical protein
MSFYSRDDINNLDDLYVLEFYNSDIYIDLNNYALYNQLQLYIKIKKWKNIFINISNENIIRKKYHCEKFCKKCNQSIIFKINNLGINELVPSFWNTYIHHSNILINFANYYYDNKHNLSCSSSIYSICDCGITFTQSNKQRHLKSKKHINIIEFMNSLVTKK